MAYDEEVAERVRSLVGGRDGYSERKMFGGICFMMHGNMFAGVVRDDLMLRVGKDAFDAALTRRNTKPMDFTGRPMVGMVFVEPPGFASRVALQTWLDDALGFVETLPAKAAKRQAKA
jgi:hypothetical protein